MWLHVELLRVGYRVHLLEERLEAGQRQQKLLELEASYQSSPRLIEERAVIWDDETKGAEFRYEEIPGELGDEAAVAREKLFPAATVQGFQVAPILVVSYTYSIGRANS